MVVTLAEPIEDPVLPLRLFFPNIKMSFSNIFVKVKTSVFD